MHEHMAGRPSGRGKAKGSIVSELHVEEWGSGNRDAVLVHGLSADSSSWWRIGPELADRGFHVRAVDLRGHGRSPRGTYSRDAWADDLLAAVPPEPALAVGHSLGAVVLSLAVERLRPSRAVYLDPPWKPVAGSTYGEGMPMFVALKDWSLDDIAKAHPLWDPQAWSHRQEALRRWDPETTAMHDLERTTWPKRAAVPSLVLAADPSPLVTEARAERLVHAGFEVVTVERAGHWIHEDDPDAVLALLDRQ
ncbi:alpha/beta fold hydrolase [Yinghuangia aomiensis]|uniref:Alpha/beta fold hydrolase n=1 Tax=Yinghuangia aomiensis TaxID=676205 RepID=A0ABP9H2B9_9ACTN